MKVNQHARMTRIDLDEQEGVKAVTFHADAMAMDWLAGTLGWAASPAGPEVTIAWPALRDVLAAAGKMTGLDPAWPASTEIYSSLSAVFYGYLDHEG